MKALFATDLLSPLIALLFLKNYWKVNFSVMKTVHLPAPEKEERRACLN
jgi:hypothetical protein